MAGIPISFIKVIGVASVGVGKIGAQEVGRNEAPLMQAGAQTVLMHPCSRNTIKGLSQKKNCRSGLHLECLLMYCCYRDVVHGTDCCPS